MLVSDLSCKAVIVVQCFSKHLFSYCPGFWKTKQNKYLRLFPAGISLGNYFSGIESFQHTMYLIPVLHSKLEITRDTLSQNHLGEGLLKSLSSKIR